MDPRAASNRLEQRTLLLSLVCVATIALGLPPVRCIDPMHPATGRRVPVARDRTVTDHSPAFAAHGPASLAACVRPHRP